MTDAFIRGCVVGSILSMSAVALYQGGLYGVFGMLGAFLLMGSEIARERVNGRAK